MKNNHTKVAKRNLILQCLVLLLSLTVPFFLLGCEPGGDLTIVNRHSQEVKIFKSHVRSNGTTDEATYQVTIEPNEMKKFSITFIGPDDVKRIEAMDPSGNVLFSHDYKMADLEKIGWKIVIPP